MHKALSKRLAGLAAGDALYMTLYMWCRVYVFKPLSVCTRGMYQIFNQNLVNSYQ